MSQGDVVAAPRTAPGSTPVGRGTTGRSPAVVLAVLGVPILALDVWSVAAWLADGPIQVTRFRDHHDPSWYAAIVLQALVVLVSVAVAATVARECVRRRTVLTFDVMFCLAGATMFWADFASNFFQPTFITSSQLVNVTNVCGHIPLVVNPDCGRAPDPLLFLLPLETFGILGVAMVVSTLIRRARARRPHLPTRRWVLVGLASGLVLDLLLEPVFISLHLWDYPAPDWMSLHLGDGFRLSLVEWLAGGLWFGALITLRAVRDRDGLALTERGLDGYPPSARKGIALLATYAFFQLAIWLVASVPLWFVGPYEPPWPALPAHVVNDVCNSPGVHGTRYGPCPGSPGYRAPVRGSLPGTSP